MIALACSKIWDKEINLKLQICLGEEILLISNKEDLNVENLKKHFVKKIYFPHWSYLIKEEIFNNFECIIFHMTDLPFGRGGSPLQNLISRGIYKTKISALRCEEGIDTGPIYLKKELLLEGSAKEIFKTATEIIIKMIIEIEKLQINPVPQIGDVVTFKRRKPEESNLRNLSSIIQIYDFIRMLDAEGYPLAFIDEGSFKYEFYDAKLVGDEVIATVRIRK